MTDDRLTAAARVLADYLKSHGYDLGDCKEMLRVAGYEALVRDNASARAELGRARTALADLVEASDEASDFTSGEAVSAFNAALGAARGVLGAEQ